MRLSRYSYCDLIRAIARIPVLLSFRRSYLFQIFADEFTAIDLKFCQIKEARGLEDGHDVFRVKETSNNACTETLQTTQQINISKTKHAENVFLCHLTRQKKTQLQLQLVRAHFNFRRDETPAYLEFGANELDWLGLASCKLNKINFI